MRGNRYGSFIRHQGDAISADAVKWHHPVVLDFAEDASRIRYYSGIEDVLTVSNSEASRNPVDMPCNSMDNFLYLGDVIYVLWNEADRRVEDMPDKLMLFDKEWEKVNCEYKDRKLKKLSCLYRYISPINDMPDSTLEALPDDANGGFEMIGASPRLCASLKILKQRGLNAFPQIQPADWAISSFGEYCLDPQAIIDIDRHAPISGKNSLRISSGQKVAIYSEHLYSCSGDIVLSFNARAETVSEINVGLLIRKDGIFTGSKLFGKIIVYPGDVEQYYLPFQLRDLDDGCKFQLWFLLYDGNIMLDDFRIFKIN